MSGARPRRLRLWALAMTVAVGCSLAAGVSLAAAAGVAAAASQPFGVTAWLPYWEMPTALDSTLAGASAIGTASPYWYEIVGDSHVHDEAGAGSATVLADLHARGVQVVPMVTEASGMRAFARILASGSRRAALVRTLVTLASHSGYAGLDLDFESFAYDPGHDVTLADSLAVAYPAFVAQTCTALHAIGRSCQVAVMARTSGGHAYAHGDIPSWVYDYKTLAAAADRVQVMAYDYHSPGGVAGPIAPLPWVRQVIAYARSQAAARRFELGLPAYGYDWYGRTSATAVYANQLPALVAQVHAQSRWDATQGEMTFSYRLHHHRHVGWVETTRSDQERAGLAARAGFSGVAVWAAGYGQPTLWPSLRIGAGVAR